MEGALTMMAEDLVAPFSLSLPLYFSASLFSRSLFLLSPWSNLSMGFCFFFFIGRENLFFWPFVLTNGKNGWLSVLGSVFRECSFWSLDLSLLRSLPLYFSVSLFSRSLCLRFFIRIAIFLFSLFSSWFPFIPRGL